MLKALGKDVAIYGAGEFIFKFIAFGVFPIYAHVFSLAQFGTWALLTVTASLLGFVVNLGVNQAVQRFYFDDASPAEEALVVSTGLAQLFLSSLLIVSAAIVAGRLGGAALTEQYGIDPLLLTLTLAFVVPDQLLQFCLDTLRLHFTPWRFLGLSFAKNIGGTALALWFVLERGAGLHGLFTGLLIGTLLAVPLGLWMIRRDLGWRIDGRLGRAMFAFGFPLTFTSLGHWIYTSLDRWMLADMSSADELGLYSAAAKYATIVTFLIAAFAQAWVPFAIRLARDRPDHAAFYGRVLSLWYLLLAMAALSLALFSREALMLLTPREFWPAAALLPLLAAGLVLFGTTLITAMGLTLEKRTWLSTWGTWLTAIANVLLNLVLIPPFGAMGAASATLFAYAMLTSFYLYWTQRLHPMLLEKGKLAYCTAVTALAASASFVDLGTSIGQPLAKGFVVLLVLAGAFAIGIIGPGVSRLIRRGGAA